MMWLLIAALWLAVSLVVGFALGWAIAVSRRSELDRWADDRDAIARAVERGLR